MKLKLSLFALRHYAVKMWRGGFTAPQIIYLGAVIG
jgi:hypothetical protein